MGSGTPGHGRDGRGLATTRSPVLTPRESEILQLIVRGMTDGEIAEQLGISRSTVDAHTAMLRSKLRVKRKDELPAAARERGLI